MDMQNKNSLHGKSMREQYRAKKKLPAVHVRYLLIQIRSWSEACNLEHELLVAWWLVTTGDSQGVPFETGTT